MKNSLILFLSLFLLFIFVGCDNGNGSDPNEPIDTNYTNVDPPFIESVTGPGQLIVGNEAQFYCEILSDAEILRKSWNLDLSAGGYFYPSSVTEGGFTPSGLRPDPFVQTDTGEAPTFNYSKRGKYTAALEIEDADGYIERSGTMVSVIPETADSAGVHIVRAASTDTVLGEDFDFLRFGLIADNVVPACVYADGYDAFSAYSYIDCDISPGYRIVRTKVETGKRIGIEGSGWFVARISVDFDVEGALHLWGGGSEDMVEYAAYITVQHTDGLPRTHYIYSKSLNSSSLDEAFYLNGNHVVEDTLNVMGNEEYEFWFGVETFQYLAPSDSSGSAVCFDDAVAPTKLNRVMFTLEK